MRIDNPDGRGGSTGAAAGQLLRLAGLGLTVGSGAGQVNILTDVTLAVEAGETVGIVGPSGSGKTSLLMLVAGLERATAGRVELSGHELGGMGEDALARFRRDQVGIVFQSFHLVPTMTALENVAIPLEFAGRPDAFASAEAMLRDVGLGHRLGHYPGQLSGGEQQRVALARALVARPRLILADEPTGNLDLATGQAVMDLLFGLSARSGATLLLVTHDPALAGRCARVVSLADGRVVGDARRQPVPASMPAPMPAPAAD